MESPSPAPTDLNTKAGDDNRGNFPAPKVVNQLWFEQTQNNQDLVHTGVWQSMVQSAMPGRARLGALIGLRVAGGRAGIHPVGSLGTARWQHHGRFRAAARSQWQTDRQLSPVGVDRPDLRVEIKNGSERAYLFPTIGAGWLTLERADGQKLQSSVRARAQRRIDWLLVPAGESYTALCQVEVKCLADGKTRQLTYTTADGTMFTFEPMSPGKYKLQFRYEMPQSQTIGDQSTWAGNVTTEPVEFEIARVIGRPVIGGPFRRSAGPTGRHRGNGAERRRLSNPLRFGLPATPDHGKDGEHGPKAKSLRRIVG